MGLLLGLLFGISGQKVPETRSRKYPLVSILAITACFLAGRLLLYTAAGIYSSFADQPAETLLWCLLTGVSAACVMAWLNRRVNENGRIRKEEPPGFLTGRLFRTQGGPADCCTASCSI